MRNSMILLILAVQTSLSIKHSTKHHSKKTETVLQIKKTQDDLSSDAADAGLQVKDAAPEAIAHEGTYIDCRFLESGFRGLPEQRCLPECAGAYQRREHALGLHRLGRGQWKLKVWYLSNLQPTLSVTVSSELTRMC